MPYGTRARTLCAVKFSFLCSQIYADPSLFATLEGWPSPPADYDPEIGMLSTDLAIEEAVLAEELDFDMVTVSEHHYWPTLPTPNAAVLAAALTQRLQRVRIGWMGPLVSTTNPVRIAEEVAMLDQLSHGRLSVLFLRGTPNEFLAYGVNPAETRERTQEAIALITRALTEPQPFGWEGRYYRYPTVSVWPGPTQRPHPPVFSSGNSPDSLRFAAKAGHAMGMSFYPQHLVAQLTAEYREQCTANGWEPTPDQILYRGYAYCAETEAEARAVEERYYGGSLISGFQGRAETVAGARAERVESVKKLAADRAGQPTEIGTDADGKELESDKKGKAAGFALGTLAFSGTPDSLVDQITEFQEATGVGILDLGFTGGGLTRDERLRSLRLFGTEVIPRTRHLGAVPATQEAEVVG